MLNALKGNLKFEIWMRNKRRLLYGILIVAIIILGLASRKYGYLLPAILSRNAGDILWATTAYFGLSFLWPLNTMLFKAKTALIFSFAIEFSQIYHAPWIDSIRHTTPGRLILGSDFSWGDLASYSIGILIALLIDGLITNRKVI
jgi:hypothetical protein